MGKGRVLVIEDDDELRHVTLTVVADAGFVAVGAMSDADALGEAARFDPDVIVLDLGLKAARGEDFLREYRKRPRGRARIVVVSGDPPERAIEVLGIDASLTKPYDIHELMSTVEALAATAVRT